MAMNGKDSTAKRTFGFRSLGSGSASLQHCFIDLYLDLSGLFGLTGMAIIWL